MHGTRLIQIVAILGLLSGCDRATQQTEAACELTAQRVTPTGSPFADIEFNSNVKTCMRAKGYRLVIAHPCHVVTSSWREARCYESIPPWGDSRNPLSD